MDLDSYDKRLSENLAGQLRAIGEAQQINRELFAEMRAAFTGLDGQVADLRETIAQLQGLVLEQGRDLQQLRKDLGR